MFDGTGILNLLMSPIDLEPPRSAKTDGNEMAQVGGRGAQAGGQGTQSGLGQGKTRARIVRRQASDHFGRLAGEGEHRWKCAIEDFS